ncbi:hypothetical protein GCM10008942_27920 [Rhizomicrobium electricum]|uniref:Uncharacterized protein n=1 Tax=Rhizomicrobium electricum TaxID=480070 RepID=A0ABN1EY38_9PROT
MTGGGAAATNTAAINTGMTARRSTANMGTLFDPDPARIKAGFSGASGAGIRGVHDQGRQYARLSQGLKAG